MKNQKKYTIETTKGVKVIVADDMQLVGTVINFISKKEKKEGAIILQDDKPEVVYTIGTHHLISIEYDEV